MAPVWVSPDDEQATFHVYQQDGSSVVVASGEVDLATAPALRRAIEVAADIAPRVVVDLASVSFIDSLGVSVLIKARGNGPTQRSLSLVQPSALVRKVLHLTRLDELFAIYDTWQDATDLAGVERPDSAL
jgi:anti-sigma B factor antagonist